MKVFKYVVSILSILSSTFVVSENLQVKQLTFGTSNGAIPTSYEVEGVATGVLPQLIIALFKEIPELQPLLQPLPWKRAQVQVEMGKSDAFCTYPSVSRQKYALFAEQPLYIWDYGYLIYNKQNPNAATIATASSFEDLRNMVFMAQPGTAWEDDNIPNYIKRDHANTGDAMLMNILDRGVGDFMIMSIEQAVYLAKKHNLDDNLGIAKVSFIPNSEIPFHIGISKTRNDADDLIMLIDRAMKTKTFLERKQAILNSFQKTEDDS